MSRYPSLTDAELRELYERNPTPEARRLLWEIDRLHGLVYELAQFLTGIDQAELAAEQLTAFSKLLAATDAEPAVKRKRAAERRYLQPPRVLACSWADPFVGPPQRWEVRAREIGIAKRKPRRR
ncbi:hypothetical protein ACL598_17465 [Bordetella bronchialis]|uniref:hypothetical protein n=1 Tax=Bordetella bronchialis TaxID=463025 RepID=UPI003D000851